MSNTRIERDSMGELHVPEAALYGAQTQRAVDNFPVSHQRMPAQFIRALILAKAAAAKANVALGQISDAQGNAIVEATQILLAGDFLEHFPVDIFQTGSGTSSNMNANEVIATLATRVLGETINPNDHVNCGQSSNDIIPTTLHVSAALGLHEELLPALEAAGTVGEFFQVAQWPPGLVQAQGAPMPGQCDISGGVDQQTK